MIDATPRIHQAASAISPGTEGGSAFACFLGNRQAGAAEARSIIEAGRAPRISLLFEQAGDSPGFSVCIPSVDVAAVVAETYGFPS